ncbi:MULTISPECIES: acetyltransferase [unclassified Caballeronia]|uniref:acetyltransferase n=1 Tax=unclassified Caballeronia TaxID=2646786 RepID=UPI00285F7091|nr:MULTISPECIES: acetyltransferase [unclassified Caballeronia]MDR5752108.1 acetyltransferase [Caballeronia sp. LZ024]MDR5843751.1 acetyltransferase [Caballeronia sp. LZ031]
MTRKLFIYGAGGFGKEVMDVARRQNAVTGRWSEIAFVDDIWETPTRHGAPVLRFDDESLRAQFDSAEFVIAVGEPAGREALANKLRDAGAHSGIVVDLSTIVADSARLGEGVVITPFCSISSDARLGAHTSINTTSIVGHDVEIGDYSVVSSMVNLGGSCVVGQASYIGMGALVKEGVRIGSNSIIGMGSVVYGDIPDNVIALGNPARVARPNTDRKVFK